MVGPLRLSINPPIGGFGGKDRVKGCPAGRFGAQPPLAAVLGAEMNRQGSLLRWINQLFEPFLGSKSSAVCRKDFFDRLRGPGRVVQALGFYSPRMPGKRPRTVSAAVIGRMTRAGLPAAKEPAGMSRVTTLPAQMTQFSPMVTPGQTTTFAPNQQSCPMVTGLA